MANVSKDDVIEFISNMSVLDLSQLVKELEEKFGVSARVRDFLPSLKFDAAESMLASGNASYEEGQYVHWHREMVQQHQGFRFHSAG